MTPDLAAKRLAELGNVTRLAIFRLLVRAGHDGMAISGIRERQGIPLSTLSFHLRGLVQAGLVDQEKVGRTVICRAVYPALDAVLGYLKEECCMGVSDLPASTARERRVA